MNATIVLSIAGAVVLLPFLNFGLGCIPHVQDPPETQVGTGCSTSEWRFRRRMAWSYTGGLDLPHRWKGRPENRAQ